MAYNFPVLRITHREAAYNNHAGKLREMQGEAGQERHLTLSSCMLLAALKFPASQQSKKKTGEQKENEVKHNIM